MDPAWKALFESSRSFLRTAWSRAIAANRRPVASPGWRDLGRVPPVRRRRGGEPARARRLVERLGHPPHGGRRGV